MSYQAIVSAMLAEGCSAEQIAAAVIALETAVEKQKQARRAADAERQRRSRELRKRGMSRDLSRDVTVTPCDPLSPKERSPAPPKEITPYPESPSLPSRLPADFEIDADDRAFGRAEGLSEAEISRSVEDMRLWAAEAVGDKALRSDWHATVRRFMRRDADGKRAGKGKPPKIVPIGKPAASEPSVFVKRDSPQGEAWWSYVKASTGRAPPIDRNGGWRFPSEWPPPERDFPVGGPIYQ